MPSCGFAPIVGDPGCPPLVITTSLTNVGQVNAQEIMDLNCGEYDDNTVLTIPFGPFAGTYGCGTGLFISSRFRIGVTMPGALSKLSIFSVTFTFYGTIWFDINGNQTTAPPSTVGACLINEFGAQSTSVGGCTIPVLP